MKIGYDLRRDITKCIFLNCDTFTFKILQIKFAFIAVIQNFKFCNPSDVTESVTSVIYDCTIQTNIDIALKFIRIAFISRYKAVSSFFILFMRLLISRIFFGTFFNVDFGVSNGYVIFRQTITVIFTILSTSFVSVTLDLNH